MAAAAVAESAEASPPTLALPHCAAAAKALTYLCLTLLWVAGADLAVAACADLAFASRGWGMDSPPVQARVEVSTEAALFSALLAVAVLLLLLRLVFAAGYRVGMGIETDKISSASVGSMLRETFVLGWLASQPFVLLGAVGFFMMFWLSPASGSRTGRIGAVIIDVGLLGYMAISCFVTIPGMALKLWRMSPGSEGASADSIV